VTERDGENAPIDKWKEYKPHQGPGAKAKKHPFLPWSLTRKKPVGLAEHEPPEHRSVEEQEHPGDARVNLSVHQPGQPSLKVVVGLKIWQRTSLAVD
jgi:hypothetical protein